MYGRLGSGGPSQDLRAATRRHYAADFKSTKARSYSRPQRALPLHDLRLVEPDSGRVMLNEADVTSLPMYQRPAGLRATGQESSVFRKLGRNNPLGVMEMLGPDRALRAVRRAVEQFDITCLQGPGRFAGRRRRRLKSPARWFPTPRSSCSTSPSGASTR